MQSHNPTPRQQYQAARAHFVSRGTSLSAWCKQRGIAPQNARKAMLGQWTGPKAERLVRAILCATEQRS